MQSLLHNRKNTPFYRHPGMNGIKLSFLLACATALCLFVPFLVVDKGFFLYCGDYNSQQLPFYYYVQGFLRGGGGSWSWATDLGSSLVNSYSFYNLGSPFLWISLLFPTSWMPYMMVPLFCLKFGCIAAACCLYLSRYAKSRNMAVVSSIIYAFCGFNVYNIFFNHMLEPVIFFPLLLWAMDAFIYEDKRGFFAVFVGLALLNSYFFFLGNVVFCLIYFFVKLKKKEYTITPGKFGALFLEAALGVGIGMVLALPALLNMMGNPRTENIANGFGLVMYGKVQQYFAILGSMFLPPDPPYLPNIFTEGAIKWTSMSAFLPVVGMAGVVAYSRRRRGGSIKLLLFISLIMALVPILNSSFYAFNASYYARWYYMPILFCCFATMRSLEDEDIDLMSGIRPVFVITCLFLLFGILPTKVDGEWQMGMVQRQNQFWLTMATALFSIGLFYVLVRFFRRKVRFAPLLLGGVMAFSVLYGVVHVALGKFPQWERDSDFVAEQYTGATQLELPDDGFYRIDAFNMHDNFGLWVNKSCLQTFNSVVTPSIMEFYPMVGVKRDVSSKPETEHYALRGLLNVRYTIVPKDEVDEYLSQSGISGWNWLREDGPFMVYENQNYVPLGFTYDKYILMEDLLAVRTEDRAALLMRGVGLDAGQQARYGHLFSGTAVTWHATTAAQWNPETETEETYTGGYHKYAPVDYASYVDDCNARRQSAAYETSYDNSGFTVKIDLPRNNLVFFGVPYDEGFTATVNGQKAEVLCVSGGMMAVYAPAGDNEIVFRYQTPGFVPGAIASVASLLVLAAYLWLWHAAKKRNTAAVAGAKGTQKKTKPQEKED